MIEFIDGEAAGESLSLARAPEFLRVVITPRGRVDALDLLGDEPKQNELIVVYRIVANTRHRYHVRAAKKSLSGWHWMAKYLRYKVQPSDLVLRSTEDWRAWVLSELGAEAEVN